MNKYKNLIGFILIASLIIIVIVQFKNNNDLNNRIDSNIDYAINRIMYSLPKDHILPVLTQKSIDKDELYELLGYIDASEGYSIRILNYNYPEVNSFLLQSRKQLEDLINLIESGAKQEEIDDRVNSIIIKQQELMKKNVSD